jgi:hypothetical protein
VKFSNNDLNNKFSQYGYLFFNFHSIGIYLSMALQPFVGPWPVLQFLDLFTQSVGLLGRGISPSQGRYLHTGQHKYGFEPTIPVFERAKTVHALGRAVTMIDSTIVFS